MTSMRPLWALLLAIAAVSAGCLAQPSDGSKPTPTPGSTPTATASPTPAPSPSGPVVPSLPALPGTGPGEMTAEESVAQRVEACGTETCAVKDVTVAGRLTFRSLEVILSSFNGDVSVEAGLPDQWELKATLVGRGGSESEARGRLNAIQFGWTHTDGARHFIDAQASAPPQDGTGMSAGLHVKVPPTLVGVLTLGTTNGDASSTGIATEGAQLSTTNGKVRLEGAVREVVLRTTNGRIDADLRPAGAGKIGASTTNGAIDVKLVEDAQHGYDLVARTTNGEVEVGLRDGQTTTSEDGDEARFKTTGYESRSIKTTVELETTNGEVSVGS